MPIKTFKSELLGRTCISTVIEMPVTGEAIYVVKPDEVIEQISIGEVKGHPDMITVAMILAPVSKNKSDA